MPIQRRTFLKGAGSLAASASFASLAFGNTTGISVGIVGGGIVGASIAMHLSRAGAKVTLFEKYAPAAGATGKSFAWINAYTSDPHYRALRLRSIAAYHDLSRILDLGITWGGAIHWAENAAEAERMKARVAEFDQAGYRASMVTPEDLAGLSPNLHLGPFSAASFSPPDGHLDPVHATRQFLNQARNEGAEILHPCEVTELQFRGNTFAGVVTTTGSYALDRLVIASGVDTPLLTAQAGYTTPLIHAPGILVHSSPTDRLVGRVVESDRMYFKQNRDGRIVGTSGYSLPEIPAHVHIHEGPQEMPDEIRKMHGERILRDIRVKLPAATDAIYDRLTLGYRPMPEDRYSIVGYSPGNSSIYVAVMHSGVTLAPIMGRYITQEILNDDSIDELAPYRPERFLDDH